MGYKYDGFFSEEDVAKYETERGKSIPDHGTGYIPKPGDVKYKDLNNDHKIDQYDVATSSSEKNPSYLYPICCPTGLPVFLI